MNEVVYLGAFRRKLSERVKEEDITRFLAQAYIDYIDVSMHINEFNAMAKLLANESLSEVAEGMVRKSLVEINKYNRKYPESFPKVVVHNENGQQKRQRLELNY